MMLLLFLSKEVIIEFIFFYMSKNDAINMMNNSNLKNRCKEPITINNVDIRKVVLSKNNSYGTKGAFKCFIGHISNAGIIPLCIILPQTNTYVKYFDKNSKYMNILVHDKKILKNSI